MTSKGLPMNKCQMGHAKKRPCGHRNCLILLNSGSTQTIAGPMPHAIAGRKTLSPDPHKLNWQTTRTQETADSLFGPSPHLGKPRSRKAGLPHSVRRPAGHPI